MEGKRIEAAEGLAREVAHRKEKGWNGEEEKQLYQRWKES